MSIDPTPIVLGSAPLYGGATPLQLGRHRNAAVLPDARFQFAAQAPTVPISVDEFTRAALDYPIVFFGPNRAAVAVTGLEPTHNLFVEPDGTYRRGSYVPAYLRRYPFILARDEAEDQWVVCLDERSDRLVAADEHPAALPLFAGDQPAAVTREAIALCRAFEEATRRTELFTRLLDDLDLFEARQAHFRPWLADGTAGEPMLLLDYAAVSRERLEALSAEDRQRLQDSGMTGELWSHVLSVANWDRLAALAED